MRVAGGGSGGGFRKVPEAGWGGFQGVLVQVPEANAGRFRRVPEGASVGSGGRVRKVPESSGVLPCNLDRSSFEHLLVITLSAWAKPLRQKKGTHVAKHDIRIHMLLLLGIPPKLIFFGSKQKKQVFFWSTSLTYRSKSSKRRWLWVGSTGGVFHRPTTRCSSRRPKASISVPRKSWGIGWSKRVGWTSKLLGMVVINFHNKTGGDGSLIFNYHILRWFAWSKT